MKWRNDDGMLIETALFRADTDDELAVAHNVAGRSSFRNVGRARRQGLEAVSYTHLDVYKRQDEGQADFRLSLGLRRMAARSNTRRRTLRIDSSRKTRGSRAQGLVPAPQTGIDVYKRQRPNSVPCGPRRTSMRSRSNTGKPFRSDFPAPLRHRPCLLYTSRCV